ncbi:Aspercryptin biosynthesis cluster-specific transcription regulator like protein [Verticillium longisporum]|nr:Aspercryptin biosynthesis cluster-specific transcription regulator like protein [Verticillium longisporum]
MEEQSTSPQLASSNTGTDSPGFTGSASSASVAKRNGGKGSRKVRTGCITCKIRRVKCDEVKPACERCTKTGRKCDGYVTTTPSVIRPQSQSSPPPSGTSIARTMSPFAAWDANDQRAFHYYRNCSATSLFTQATSTFWARIVPALCFEEPAALRSLQQWRTPSAPGMRGTASVTVPLLTCLLFICIEFMLGDMSAAMVHIIQGRAILAKLAEDPQEAQGPAADLIRRELVPVYTRLSVASFVFGAKPVPIPTELRPQRPANIVFDRLEDAELSLHEIIDDGLRFAKDAKAWVFTADPTSLNWAAEIKAWRARSAELTRRSDQWQVAFAVLIAAQGGGSTGAARMCRLYYLTLTVYLGTALTRLECSFDEHMTTFASIVDVAGEILQDEEARGAAAPDSDGARFSFESGIVPPLYYTAVKCRHPELRRAAIRLLRRKGALDCKENLWDARLVARIAMRIVELEETRALKILGKGVPEPDSRHAKAYIPARDEIQNFLKSIPGNRPPSIPHEEAEWIFEAEAAGPVPEGDVVDALGLPDDDDARSSPFLVPEAARVMNADISPRVSGGSWVTFWVVPQMEGEQRWDVIREFVARGTQKSPILNRV